MLGKYIIVGTGGAVGSLIRWGISLSFIRLGMTGFPFATLLVNLLGAFIIAFLYSKISVKRQKVLLFFATGLIGSFTTFSTFSVELLELVTGMKIMMAIIYFIISLLGGFLFIRLGIMAGKRGTEKC
jgi:fluoride exporter